MVGNFLTSRMSVYKKILPLFCGGSSACVGLLLIFFKAFIFLCLAILSFLHVTVLHDCLYQ